MLGLVPFRLVMLSTCEPGGNPFFENVVMLNCVSAFGANGAVTVATWDPSMVYDVVGRPPCEVGSSVVTTSIPVPITLRQEVPKLVVCVNIPSKVRETLLPFPTAPCLV